MSKRDEIKAIWTEAFDDPRAYVDMYFSRVYNDSDAMTLAAPGTSSPAVSSLLLQRYSMHFHGKDTGMAYVAGAATRRNWRGHGLMSRLMTEALKAARQRGDMVCALIPAREYLYYYYDRFDFSTVFFIDPQRFTAEHSFSATDHEDAAVWTEVEDHFSEDVFAAFERLERRYPCRVLHTRRDFLNILDDLRMDGGQFAVVADGEGVMSAMAWAVPDPETNGIVTVRDLLAESDEAALAVLRVMRAHWPHRPFKLMAHPDPHNHRRLYPRGMARIVNVEQCLSLIATANERWHSTIRVSDPIIAENNNIYRVANGSVTVIPCDEGEAADLKLDFDVPLSVFNEIVFSSSTVGDILGFPSMRPVMSLMLD